MLDENKDIRAGKGTESPPINSAGGSYYWMTWDNAPLICEKGKQSIDGIFTSSMLWIIKEGY